MKASDFSTSKYLTANDFSDMPATWTIAGVGSEIIGRGDDAAEKAVLTLTGGDGVTLERRLVLNVTNLRALARAFGDEMEAWIGKPVRIQSIWVNFRGEQVRGIQVTPGVATLKAASGGSRRRAGFGAATGPDDEIPF